MFLRTLQRKGIALALGCVLALGLAAPALAAGPAGPGGPSIEGALLSWWAGLWTGKTAPAGPAEASAASGFELERSSGVDPNGRKSLGHATPRSSPRPARPTFTCETIR
jgi:hypothetical protein